jgi:hypothetical protein
MLGLLEDYGSSSDDEAPKQPSQPAKEHIVAPAKEEPKPKPKPKAIEKKPAQPTLLLPSPDELLSGTPQFSDDDDEPELADEVSEVFFVAVADFSQIQILRRCLRIPTLPASQCHPQ